MADGPSYYNFALAQTSWIAVALGASAGLSLMTWTLADEGILAGDWLAWLWVAVAAVLVAALGAYLGLILLWPILGTLAARIQGAPFNVGDAVWVLEGRRRGTKAVVYEIWKERGQVRVDLGAEARERCEDVFCIVAVCR